MNIAIFGASGATGKLLTTRCLTSGYNVTALVRTPSKFRMPADSANRLRVIEGNAFDSSAVRQTIEGADVVLSALGARSLKKEDVLERAVPLIVSAMQQTGVRRIIVLGSAGALATSLDRQPAGDAGSLRRSCTPPFSSGPSRRRSPNGKTSPTATSIGQWSCLRCSPTRRRTAPIGSMAMLFPRTAAASRVQTSPTS